MALNIIPSQTGAFTSDPIEIDGDKIPATIVAIGLSSGEEIGIEISNDGGSTWEQVRVGASDFKVTYETAHTLIIGAKGTIRFVKGITTNPVSLGLSVKDNV